MWVNDQEINLKNHSFNEYINMPKLQINKQYSMPKITKTLYFGPRELYSSWVRKTSSTMDYNNFRVTIISLMYFFILLYIYKIFLYIMNHIGSLQYRNSKY